MGVLNDELCKRFGDAKNAEFGQQREYRDGLVRYGAENELRDG